MCNEKVSYGDAEPPGVRPLDGVTVEAIEIYQNPKLQSVDFGLGIWPVNPYYNGFSLNAGYTRNFSKTYSWEVINGDYVFTIDKGLTSELAESFDVNPERIERINFLISSNLRYTHSYGKTIFLKEYIRYFRSAILAGPALLATQKGGSMNARVGINFGWRVETFINDDFSWKFELRDTYAFGGFGNNITLIFGSAYGF
ncbi:MAG: hypothetical protein A2Z20_00235 [Bdellovibrionales bacterium RBG_16_40_8]|nr:MAG: hypothetical protein A2Z20_00235 [Bdellovibrionales bacterium RBG_16_40_8]